MTVLTGVSSKETLNVHSQCLTWFLEEASVTELFMCLLSLDHITGPIYLMLFPICGSASSCFSGYNFGCLS